MDADGGMARHPQNKAGAALGTGYCDAQCPQDVHFVDGLPNSVGWAGGKGGSLVTSVREATDTCGLRSKKAGTSCLEEDAPHNCI